MHICIHLFIYIHVYRYMCMHSFIFIYVYTQIYKQLPALVSTERRLKTTVMAERLIDINPALILHAKVRGHILY